MKIAIIGLGFVGLSFASVLASKGYSIVGIDSDTNKVKNIRAAITPFYEPKLDVLLKRALTKSLIISDDVGLAVKACNLIFITVGTPLSKDNYVNLTMLKNVINKIGAELAKSSIAPVIIIKSTIVPGTTQYLQRMLEKKSNKILGKGFGLVVNPEFLREGKAIDDTLKPHIIVIGGKDKIAINKIKRFYSRLYGKKVPTIITNYQTAELIKYANNSFLATKISFINQIANICQTIPGTNVVDVARAIGLDPRIGNLFLKAGPGYGGSCLPKDLQALIGFSSKMGSKPLLLKAVQETNTSQLKRLLKLIETAIGKIRNKRITILGLSFKEDSNDIRESVSIRLIRELLKNSAKITVHDPKAIDNVKLIFKEAITYSDSVRDALKNSQCAIIMTPWSEYSKLTNMDLKVMDNKVVIDSWRVLNHSKINAKYYAIGMG